MKRFRYCIAPIAVAAFALFASSLRADVVVLKGSGERLEGKVLSETDTSIVFEYKLTAKIKDTRTINKADIQELTRLTPSQLEFAEEKLDTILPTPDLLTAAQYEAIIQDRLRTFVAKYPGTPEAIEVESIITALSEEKAKTVNGQLKVEGKWLDEAAVKRDAYGIDAYRVRLNMKAAAEKNEEMRYTKALREFDKLQTSYPASLSYVAAIPEALEIMDKYDRQLSAMIIEQPVLQSQRESGIKQLTGPDASMTKASIEQEVSEFKSTFDAQKKGKVKWKDIYKYNAESLKDAQTTLTKERVALKALNIDALGQENKALTEISRALADENATEAEALMSKLPKNTMTNKAAVISLEKQLTALQTTLKNRKKEEVAANVRASATETKGDPNAPEDTSKNALAEALKKKSSGASGDEKTEGDAKDGDKTKDPAKDKAVDKAKDKPAATPPAPAPEPEEETSAIMEYIPLIGGGLVVILLVAFLLGKRKKKEE